MHSRRTFPGTAEPRVSGAAQAFPAAMMTFRDSSTSCLRWRRGGASPGPYECRVYLASGNSTDRIPICLAMEAVSNNASKLNKE